MEPTSQPEKDYFYTAAKQVGCDGGLTDGALGHPLVFLELEDNGNITCPYCSRKYIHQEA